MELSYEDYLKLRGLKALAEHHDSAMREICVAMNKIAPAIKGGTWDELNGSLWSDCLWSDISVDETLRCLKIERPEPPAKEAE